jgi:hypothetical protein
LVGDVAVVRLVRAVVVVAAADAARPTTVVGDPAERADVTVVVARAAGTVLADVLPPLHRVPIPALVATGVGDEFVAPAAVSIHATASCSVPLQATPTPSLVALGASTSARCGGEPIHQIVGALLG